MKDHCRIYGIMAREAPVCVLFRRGPSQWTQLLKWNTDSDTFTAGHWFKGRVYWRRGDVSPDGRSLIYFAAKINARTVADTDGYTYAWTAISSPPQYTALMLWPKGDCWHGGGHFKSNHDVWLNHRPEVAHPHPKHAGSLFKVTPNPGAYGEDEPVHSLRLERDGWSCVQPGNFIMTRSGWETKQTEVWEKTGRAGIRLRREILEFDFKSYGGPYVERFALLPKNGIPVVIPDASWADFDQKGRVVFARVGTVFRCSLQSGKLEEAALVDLNDNEPPKRAANQTSAGTVASRSKPSK